LKEPGSSSTSPSRFPRIFVEKPPVQPQHARFERGRQNRLEKRLPGLEVLSRDRHFMLLRQLPQRRHVHGQVWRSVSIRDAAGNRRPGIQHRGRNRRVILFHRGFKRFRRGVDSCVFMNTSVEPHHSITMREQPCFS